MATPIQITAPVTREQLRMRINTLETLHDVLAAIDDVQNAELGVSDTLRLSLEDGEKRSVAFLHTLPPTVVLAGLRAMQSELSSMLGEQS